MLYVDCRDDVYPFIAEHLDVLPSLCVTRTRYVGVSELVDDDYPRAAGDDRFDVHFLEGHAAVLDAPPRHDLQIPYLGFSLCTLVWLDKADNYVDAAPTQVMSFLQHAVGLSDAGSRADIDFELATVA